MIDPIKITLRMAVEITIFAMIVGVLAVYIMLSRDFVISNGNETSRMLEMRDSKAMLEYSMLDYATKDDVIMFTAKFRDEIDIDIIQSNKMYKLEKHKQTNRWDINEVRDFLDTSSVAKYNIDLEREAGDATKLVRAKITVIE